MPFQIDGSLYPDTKVPTRLETLGDRVDFLARLCAAWDFGILPDQNTITTIRAVEWRQAVLSPASTMAPSSFPTVSGATPGLHL
jgi:hypothetical protein